MDVDDLDAAAAFWSRMLGLRTEVLDDGDRVLVGDRPERSIWLNDVPEPRTVKNRVHLDVTVASLQPLLEAGARVLRPQGDGGIGWTVLADADGDGAGGELCAFLRPDQPADPPAVLHEIVVDTADSASSEQLAAWWADVLGARSADDGRGFWWVQDIPGAPFESLDIVPVPEPKTVKNRIHWDVACDDVDELVTRGATLLNPPQADRVWHVLADPQGNEFCAFPAPTT